MCIFCLVWVRRRGVEGGLTLAREARILIRGLGCAGFFLLKKKKNQDGGALQDRWTDGPRRPDRDGRVVADAEVVPDRVGLHAREDQTLQRLVAKAGGEQVRAWDDGVSPGTYYSYHGKRTVCHVVGAQAVERYTDHRDANSIWSIGEVDLLEEVRLRVEYLGQHVSKFISLSQRRARHAHFG